ncbi:hypothetical protein KSF78_0008800 [Schistosoma japonicum]|nr:hypothetical protein KSF78_0008800 [Schistosoma japonicum]
MMSTQHFILSLTIFIIISNLHDEVNACRELGEECVTRGPKSCCEPLICGLKSHGTGVCVKCIPGGSECKKSEDCCSKRCKSGYCKFK